MEASNAIEAAPVSGRIDTKYGRSGTKFRTATYRSDIDILRCLAIFAVLFYHFKIERFSGGFVGVDVFFVISGYLITGIISNETLQGIFSFSSFYNRRARRLIPALLTTILLTFVVSYFVFFPADFIRQSKATVFSLLSASNLLFWTESGYFDVDSSVKPLLHTWSLSVEFQFYAVWPVFIYFLVKAKRYTKISLSAAAAISFVACQYMLYHDSVAAFFLTPFRIWEFAVGGLVVLLERRRIQNVIILEGLYLTGLFLIVTCIVAYGRDTAFPGMAALPPVIGTAFMIYSGSGAKTSTLFDQYPLRYLGQISYSLYLVHWPILVYSLYFIGPSLRQSQTIALLGLTLVLAVLLFNFIEVPFRNTKTRRVSPFVFNSACLVLVVGLVLPAAYGWASNGLGVWRLSKATIVRTINAYDLDQAKEYVWSNYDTFSRSDDFHTGKLRMLLIGDSQSADILNMLVEAGIDNKVEIITRRVNYECGVPYLDQGERNAFFSSHNPMTMNSPQIIKACDPLMDRLISTPAIGNANVIVVSFSWWEFARPYLNDSLQAISKKGRGQMWVVGNKVFNKSSVEMVNDVGQINGIERYAASMINQEAQHLNVFLKALYGPRFIDILSLICPSKESCHILTDKYAPVLWDHHHLTKEGATFIWMQGGSRLFSFLESPQ